MNLYVWDHHFCDYYDGLAVVRAYNLGQARRILREKVGFDHEDIDKEPRIYTHDDGPIAFFVYGGM